MYSRNDKPNSNISPNHNGGLFSKIFGRNKRPKTKQNDSNNDSIDSISHSQSSPKIFNQNDTNTNKMNDNNSSHNSNNSYKRSYHNVFSFVNDPHIKKDYDSFTNELDASPKSAFKHKKIPSMFDLPTNVSNNEIKDTNTSNSFQQAPNTQYLSSQANKLTASQNEHQKNLEPIAVVHSNENNSTIVTPLPSPFKNSK